MGREGTVLVAALVCLLVVMSILAVMLQGTLRVRRQLHTERDARQAQFLLQAGIDRAAFQVSRDANYRGELWKLPPDAIIGKGKGQVTIDVSPGADLRPLQVRVVAEYPVGDTLSVRRSRTFLIPSEQLSKSE